MDTLFQQTRSAIKADLYYLALMSALAIPDMAAALESGDGTTKGQRYGDWYEKWVRPRLKESRQCENPLTGDACWDFRCTLLHQGRSSQGKKTAAYKKIFFFEPNHPIFKNNHYMLVGGEALLIKLDEFVEELLQGCELWLSEVRGTQPFEQYYANFVRRRPEGSPHTFKVE